MRCWEGLMALSTACTYCGWLIEVVLFEHVGLLTKGVQCVRVVCLLKAKRIVHASTLLQQLMECHHSNVNKKTHTYTHIHTAHLTITTTHHNHPNTAGPAVSAPKTCVTNVLQIPQPCCTLKHGHVIYYHATPRCV